MPGDFSITYPAGGNLDKVSTVNEVQKVSEVGYIKNFPVYTQPYNEMAMLDIPAIAGVYPLTFHTPSDKACEVLAITVTCSGYDENDYYDLYVGDEQWFKNWYLSEVKEGLFLGTSTFVYEAQPNTEIKLEFHNEGGTSKKCWLGVRMLVDKQSTQI